MSAAKELQVGDEIIGWVEGSTHVFCINKTNTASRGTLILPRKLGKDEPFVSTNLNDRSDHATGWVDCPKGCGFALWVDPDGPKPA